MSGAGFILAINLTVAGLIAAAFMLIALYDRAYLSARWIALAYGLGAVYYGFEFLIAVDPGSRIVATLAYAAFLGVLAAFAVGIARKYDVRPPWLAIGLLFAASVLLNLYTQTLPRDLILRNVLWQAPYAAMQAVAVFALVRSGRRGPLDIALGGVLALSALHFLAKPLIAAASGGPGEDPQSYLDTTYALFSQALGNVLFVAVAILTLAVYVRAMLADATVRSMTDALSGLLTRGGFEERSEAVLSAMSRAGMPASLIICDLDDFKAVNDTYGHAIGDKVIVAFAAILRDVSGGNHIVGRIGGEEFALVVSGAGLQTTRLVAEGSRVAFSDVKIAELEDHRLSASFGVAEMLSGESYGDLLRRADMALYDAKNAGRDCVRLAPPTRLLKTNEPPSRRRRANRED